MYRTETTSSQTKQEAARPFVGLSAFENTQAALYCDTSIRCAKRKSAKELGVDNRSIALPHAQYTVACHSLLFSYFA